MKGAIAELWAKMMSAATRSSARIIGVSHHHLLWTKKARRSPAIPMRLIRPSRKLMPRLRLFSDFGRLRNDAIAQHEHIHPACHERSERLLRRVDDGLAPKVERRVEEHGDPCHLSEALDQAVIALVDFRMHRLQPPGAIDVCDGRDHRTLV